MHSRWSALEAGAYLAVARAAVRLVPFRWLTCWFTRPPRSPELIGEQRAAARRDVVASIARATQWLPGETVCFPQAMAAQAMLRRRGVGTTLYCGAATAEAGLTAHVWLQDGDTAVTGEAVGSPYRPLASYSGRAS